MPALPGLGLKAGRPAPGRTRGPALIIPRPWQGFQEILASINHKSIHVYRLTFQIKRFEHCADLRAQIFVDCRDGGTLVHFVIGIMLEQTNRSSYVEHDSTSASYCALAKLFRLKTIQDIGKTFLR